LPKGIFVQRQYANCETTSILSPQPYEKSPLSNLSTQPYLFQGS